MKTKRHEKRSTRDEGCIADQPTANFNSNSCVKNNLKYHEVHSDYLALPLVSRGQFFGGLDANFGVPLARRKHSHLIQELINACDQVLSVSGLIRHITEELEKEQFKS